MNEAPILGFVDVLALQHQGQRRLSAGSSIGNGLHLSMAAEGVEVVAAITEAWRALLGVAPDPVFEHLVPAQPPSAQTWGGCAPTRAGFIAAGKVMSSGLLNSRHEAIWRRTAARLATVRTNSVAG